MKNLRVVFICLGCLVVALGAVVWALVSARPAANATIDISALQAQELQAPVYGSQNKAAQTAASGANDFAFRLSAALAKQAGTDNLVCSPYSAWLPLAALVNATNPAQQQELLAALGSAGLSGEDIDRAASRMLYDLTGARDEGEYNPLKIANALFVSRDLTLKEDFAQRFLDNYRGQAMRVDFASPQAAQAVNQWASDNTEGLIPSIIEEFDPQTVAAMANAIYFSDRWKWEFDPQQSVEDVFYAPDGESKAVYMLRQGDNQTYYEDEKVQAMPLSFKTGGGLYIILPKDGDAAGLLSSLNSGYFEEIRRDSVYATGKLLLPRFRMESPVMQLSRVLADMGVPLFDSSAAPLTGGLIEEDIPLWLSGAVHKAVIEVDEKGTTAAAVTIIPASGDAPPEPTEPFALICNKPFVFVLYANTYDGGDQVLFTGIVNRP